MLDLVHTLRTAPAVTPPSPEQPDIDDVLADIMAATPQVRRGFAPRDHYTPDIQATPTTEIWISGTGSGGSGTKADPFRETNGQAAIKALANNQHVNVWIERGHTYDLDLVDNGDRGLDADRPLCFRAYGVGSDPILEQQIGADSPCQYLYFDGFRFREGIRFIGGHSHLYFTNSSFEVGECVLQGFRTDQMNYVTMRNVIVRDVYRRTPVNGTWLNPGDNRISGIFASWCNHFKIDTHWIHQCGGGPIENPNLDPLGDQPNSTYNHGIYVQRNCLDFEARNGIYTSNASHGLMARSAGNIFNCAFIDNGIGCLMDEGSEYFDGNGHHLGLMSNCFVSRPHNIVNDYAATGELGAVNWGMNNQRSGNVAYNTLVARSIQSGARAFGGEADLHFSNAVIDRWGSFSRDVPSPRPELTLPTDLYAQLGVDFDATRQAIMTQWLSAYYPD